MWRRLFGIPPPFRGVGSADVGIEPPSRGTASYQRTREPTKSLIAPRLEPAPWAPASTAVTTQRDGTLSFAGLRQNRVALELGPFSPLFEYEANRVRQLRAVQETQEFLGQLTFQPETELWALSRAQAVNGLRHEHIGLAHPRRGVDVEVRVLIATFLVFIIYSFVSRA